MPGYILLEGGSEFGGQMSEPDKRAIQLAGGVGAKICIIPTAAAPDHNDRRAGQNGVHWFQKLGATQVSSLPLIDKTAANSAAIVEALQHARFIYLLGGFPDYLAQTLLNSESWRTMVQAYQAGAVIGGSSAGAMVLCEHYYDPDRGIIQTGLGLVPHACVIPHHDTFGKHWAPRLSAPILLGIDEQTGMINDGPSERWNVYGRGAVTIYKGGEKKIYRPGEPFFL